LRVSFGGTKPIKNIILQIDKKQEEIVESNESTVITPKRPQKKSVHIVESPSSSNFLLRKQLMQYS